MKCKVLHLRLSGSSLGGCGLYDNRHSAKCDLQEFAEWAFGPQGFPELKLLAYGGFSQQGLYEEHNRLHLRTFGSTPSAEVSVSSDLAKKLLSPHMEALGACVCKQLDDGN